MTDGAASTTLDTEAAMGDRLLPGTQRGRWLVVAVLALALALRAGVVLADDGYQPVNDSLHFDLIATSLANGDGYEPALFGMEGGGSYRAPLYPTSLAVVYAVFGDHSWTAGRLANGVLGTALVALIALLATQLMGRRVGAVALVLAAVHPTLILYCSSLMSEPLMATLVVAATAAAIQHRRRPEGLRWALVAGVLVGLAALTRETGLFLAPGLALLVWPTPRRLGGLAPAFGLALAAVAVVAPWTIRNAVQLDAFVPISTSGGYTFAGTYNQTSRDNPRDPGIWMPPEVDPAMAEVIASIEDPNEVSVDRELRRAALEFVQDHPGYVPEVLFWNTVRFFDLQGPRSALEYAPYVPYSVGLTRVAVYASWVVWLLAIGGLAAGAARRVPRALWLFPSLVLVLHIAMTANLRYRAVLEPFAVLLAAFAITQLIDRRRAGASGS